MRKSRFTEAQIVVVLQKREVGAKTAELVRRHGVNEQTLYRWKKKYGGMQVARPSGRSRSRRKIGGSSGSRPTRR